MLGPALAQAIVLGSKGYGALKSLKSSGKALRKKLGSVKSNTSPRRPSKPHFNNVEKNTEKVNPNAMKAIQAKAMSNNPMKVADTLNVNNKDKARMRNVTRKYGKTHKPPVNVMNKNSELEERAKALAMFR